MPDRLSAADFLAGYWQKKPLFMPAALPSPYPLISADELAWLATQSDVESRLVSVHERHGRARYRLEEGPFPEHRLRSLPDTNWTLLIQDVEKHLPDFRDLFTAVSMVPDWRIDDLMISVAAPGGGVGPHQDNYDVFLCQATGTREWRLAEHQHATPSESASGLSLLEPFSPTSTFLVQGSDVLYLPPGVPHWGIAKDLCITYSIGCRAPEASDLQRVAERLFPNAMMDLAASDAQFYADPDLAIAEAVPGQISTAALRRARSKFPFVSNLRDDELAEVLGTVATETKAWLSPEGVPADEAAQLSRTSQRSPLSVHGMARLAWIETRGANLLFANGLSYVASARELAQFQAVCRERRDVTPSQPSAPDRLLQWLLESGALAVECLETAG